MFTRIFCGGQAEIIKPSSPRHHLHSSPFASPIVQVGEAETPATVFAVDTVPGASLRFIAYLPELPGLVGLGIMDADGAPVLGTVELDPSAATAAWLPLPLAFPSGAQGSRSPLFASSTGTRGSACAAVGDGSPVPSLVCVDMATGAATTSAIGGGPNFGAPAAASAAV